MGGAQPSCSTVTETGSGGTCELSNQGRRWWRWAGRRTAPARKSPRTPTSHGGYQAFPALYGPSRFCTGRGRRRRDSGRPRKAGYGECASPACGDGAEKLVGTGGEQAEAGPGPPRVQLRSLRTRVHLDNHWDLIPSGSQRGGGACSRDPGRPVRSLRATTSAPAPSLSGQLCARSPASPPACAVTTRRVIREQY